MGAGLEPGPVSRITVGPAGWRYSKRYAVSGSAKMTRRERNELERNLAQARRRALEPTDALTLERLAQQIEDLELKLLAQRFGA
jgi:hypothetical protein